MAVLISIDDPDDSRVAPFREVRERDLVGRDGGFIAEGEVVLRVAAASRHGLASVLIDPRRADKLAPLLETLPPEVPVYAAAQEVLDAIAGFHLHRGILALGRRAPEPSAGALLDAAGERAVVVVLSGIGNHDNMGGVFRNAAAFGAQAVLLDRACCDPLYRKAIRVSVGATLKVPFARLAPGEDALALLAERGFTAIALSPSGETELSDFTPAARTAALFGAEGPGLAPDLLARARTVRIAMAGGFDSLNVATTSGVVLHHLTRLPSPSRGEGSGLGVSAG